MMQFQMVMALIIIVENEEKILLTRVSKNRLLHFPIYMAELK